MEIINISAIDGAGKTTLTQGLKSQLEEDDHDVMIIHWTSDSFLKYIPSRKNWAKPIIELITGADENLEEEFDAGNGDFTKQDGRLIRKMQSLGYHLALIIKLLFVIINYVFMIVYINIRYKGEDYIILDRNSFDDIVQLKYLGLHDTLVWFGLTLINTSDTYYLQVPYKIAMRRDRKSDGHKFPEDYYRRKVSYYEKYCRRYDISTLNAKSGPKEVLEEISADIKKNA